MQAIWNMNLSKEKPERKKRAAVSKYDTRVNIAKEVNRSVQAMSNKMAHELMKEIMESLRSSDEKR